MNSLRQRLLLLILLPLFVLIGVGAYVSYGRAVESANQAYDRSLYLAARTLAEEIRLENQTLRVDVLRAAGYLFENHIGLACFTKLKTKLASPWPVTRNSLRRWRCRKRCSFFHW